MAAEKRKAARDPAGWTAVETRERVARGEVAVEAVAEAVLARIAAEDEAIGAFAFVDPARVRAEARRLDAYRASGRPLGPMHGVPVAIKDVIDTADMPTENGTVLDAGRRPGRDATLVTRLRAAGALVVGKTVATELAFLHPARTRNPHDPERTPGGSSSGSAAAVAAGMLPLAVGTQTAGSVIRPASFCGIVGFKPTHGLVSRAGVLQLAAPLDTIGGFARTVEDVALLVDAMAGHDPADPDTRVEAAPQLLATASSRPPVRPDLAFVRGPAWDEAAPETKAAFAELEEVLGDAMAGVDLPDIFQEAAPAHRRLVTAGMARNLRRYCESGWDALSETMQATIEEGRTVTAVDYLSALDWRDVLGAGLDRIFERYDAILTPAATGEAPLGLGSTGSPAFSVLWTLCGLPSVTLPLLEGPNGLPVGVQLVGRRGHDGRLLRTARWLATHIGAATQGDERHG